ncbi:MAG: PilN domain-containing protein [Polyangia bacterium]|jgi:Tfp pilus assembly protein PilN|nr:PilN domain-containing protein [Polyangia bacterium]
MIRINLLPYKESTLRQWGQRQVVIYAVIMLVSVVAMAILARPSIDYNALRVSKEKERKAEEAEIARIGSQVICDRDDLNRKIKAEQRKYRTVEKLITERQNPKQVLRELSRILSEAWGPTIKQSFAGKDKRALYNQNWDPTGVWITSFAETSSPDSPARTVRIQGGALAADDVAEFWRRLQVSAYFYNVDLERFSKVKEMHSTSGSGQFLSFSIVSGVKY